jgi:hypothetical protein
MSSIFEHEGLSAVALVMALGLLAGCGTWVKYPDDHETPGTTALDDFPDVDHLGHLAFDALLAEHTALTGDGLYVLVDYDGIAASGESSYLLEQYLATLNTVDPTDLDGTAERQAYWLNAYNAGVIHGVVQGYEGDHGYSVLDSGVFFDDPIHAFAGLTLTLNQVENGVLRGDWDHASMSTADADTLATIELFHADVWDDGVPDARLHFAVNCASLGCPNLRAVSPFAFKPATLEDQLDEVTMEFCLNEEKGVGADGISRIFDWYGEDFDAEFGGVASFIENHRDGGLDGVDLDSWLDYDWSLNIVE